MEDDSADLMGDALDELDDLFEDEDLFQDLEDLGKVLDELKQQSDEADTSSGLEIEKECISSPKTNQDDKSKPLAKDAAPKSPGIPSIVDSGEDVCDASSSKSQPVNEKDKEGEELEDGEILESDEKKELKELNNRKSEIVNKMKKLVRHKIQLTTQRNDLLLQLQSNSQLDKVNTLLKNNSQLVKAISNQIFRMNPEIKMINRKIKDLEASVGSETCDNQSAENSSSVISTSKRDLQNVENFFDRLSGVKLKKEKKDGDKKAETRDGNSRPKAFTAKNVLSVDVSKSLKSNLAQTDNSANIETVVGSINTPRLINDSSKLMKIFERVCEMTEKKHGPTSSSSELEDTGILLEKKSDNDSACQREKQNTPSSSRIDSNSVGENIDFRLKEIRMSVATSKTPTKDVIGFTGMDSENVKQGKLPVRTETGSSAFDGVENSAKKRKHKIEIDFDKPSSSSIKKSKTVENTVATSISKSLLQRLGTIPSNERQQGASVSIDDDLDDADLGNYYSGVSEGTRDMPGDRKAYWCQYCNRAFKSTPAYVTHLESKKHLHMATAKQFSNRGRTVFPDDSAASETLRNNEDAWYKGKAKGYDKSSPACANTDVDEDLCIAVVGTDTFCKKKKLGYSHVRCFAHAKCLIRSQDNSTGYSPDLCSVCSEYLAHCHSSLKCCEKIFRIFKFYRKRFGLSFDWENKFMKDWFFDNYRKIQGANSSDKSLAISYEDFKLQEKRVDTKTPDIGSNAVYEKPPVTIEDSTDTLNEKPLVTIKDSSVNPSEKLPPTVEDSSDTLCIKPAIINDSLVSNDKPASSTEVRSDLRSLINKMRNSDCSTASSPQVKISDSSNDALCSFLDEYCNVERTVLDNNIVLHSYIMSLEETDPFITEVCKTISSNEANNIPSTSLLSYFHTQFSSKNTNSQKVMTLLHNKPLENSDISFQLGSQIGYCRKALLEKFNTTVVIAKSHFNCYAAFRTFILAVEKFSLDNAPGPEITKFHQCLTQSMSYLANEMVNPLKYYIQLAILEKQRLRKTGFKIPSKDDTVATLVRYNIFSQGLFDQAALKKAAEHSKHLGQLLNTEEYEESSNKEVFMG